MTDSDALLPILFRHDRFQWGKVQNFFRRSAEVVSTLDETLPGIAKLASDCLSEDVESLATGSRRGKLTSDFPVHAMLVELSSREILSNTRVVLALHVCSHAIRFLKNPGNVEKAKPNRFEEVCRALRKMSDRELACFESPLPTTRVGLCRVLENLTYRQSKLEKQVHDRLVALKTFLHFSSNYRPRGTHTKQTRTFGSHEPANFEENDEDAPSVREQVIKIRPEEERGLTPENHHAAAGSNYEGYSGSTFRQLNEPAPDLPSESTRRLRIHQTELHRKRCNVIQPFRWEVLSQAELTSLVTHVLEGPSDAGLAIILCLVTGRSLDQVLDAGVSEHKFKSKYSDLFLHPDGTKWRAPIVLPEDRRKIMSHWRHYLEPGVRHIEMPMPKVVSAVFVALGKDRVGQRIFPSREVSRIREDIKALLSEVNGAFGGRLTELRIRRSLFTEIAGFGDVADASLITSASPPFGQAASAFYYRTTVEHLRALYVRAVGRLLNCENDQTRVEEAEQSNLLDQWVGSEFKVRSDLLRLLVNDLIANVDHARKHANAVGFHNHLTSYCLLFLAFTTGHRSIRDPLKSQYDIDWHRGFLVIDDKSGSGNRARIVPIIESLQEQLRAYVEYRDALCRRLRISEQPLFFYVDSEFNAEQVTPKRLADHIRYATDLPLNMNRHFLRSELRRAGVSGQTVDYFMGHWDDGQEPFAHYSTLSPRCYREELMGPLKNITETVGWKPIVRML